MWFKQGIGLDDWNFDMENYSSLVDVKLLLKKILDSYWNKLLCEFCITVRRFHVRVQSSTCATYEKCNNGRANSRIGYTTDCLYSFWDRQRAESCMLHSFVSTIANIYLAEKIWALLTDLLKNLYMAIAPFRYTSKRIAKWSLSNNIITSMELGFSGVPLSFFR